MLCIEKKFVSMSWVYTLVLAVACFIVVTRSAAAEGPGINLGPNNTAHVSGGQTITYIHELTNIGDISGTVIVEASSQNGWRVELEPRDQPGSASLITMNLGVSQTVTIELSVTVPASAALMTDVALITATSQLSPTIRATATDTTSVLMSLYLPVVVLPLPTPTLTQIDNSDQDNSYYLYWSAIVGADSYIIQEATNPSFTNAVVINASGYAAVSLYVNNRAPNTYYYRVKATGPAGTSNWSNAQSVVIYPLFVGLSLRWDGNGYVRGSEYQDIGSHSTANFMNLTDSDTIQALWNDWYDPNPYSWSSTQEYDYYSVSTSAWKSSTAISDPSWKWGDPFMLRSDHVLVNGQVTYINGQAFDVTGPFQGYTAFGKSIGYWQLVNRDRFLFWDGGDAWTQYVHPGEVVLRYDAGNTGLKIYSNIKRHYYYNGNLTSDTVQYIDQLTSANSIPAVLTSRTHDIPQEDTTSYSFSNAAGEVNTLQTPMLKDGMKEYSKSSR